MSILTRYILKEHTAPFLSGVTTITFLFLLNLVFRDLGKLLGKGLPLLVILEFFALNLAWIVAIAVPMGVLVATLMAFGRMSADSEISAMKAGGIHLYRLMAPMLGVGFVLMIGMERFNNVVLPEANHRVRVLSRDISRTRPTLTMEPHVFFDDVEDYSLLVHDISPDGKGLSRVIIDDHSDPKINKTVIADSGEIVFSPSRGMMVLTLYDGEVHEVDLEELDAYRRLHFERQVLTIPVPNMTLERSESKARGDREKTDKMLREDIAKNLRMMDVRRDRIRELVKSDLDRVFPDRLWGGGDVEEGPTTAYGTSQALGQARQIHQQIQGTNRVIEGYRRSTNSLTVELHKHYSIPVACLVFVLVGVPLGIMSRHGGMVVAGGFSMFAYLIYWTFLIGGEQLADRNLIDPVSSMWAPNVIIGLAGAYLTAHTVREATFIRWDEWGRRLRGLVRRGNA